MTATTQGRFKKVSKIYFYLIKMIIFFSNQPFLSFDPNPGFIRIFYSMERQRV